MSQNKKDGLVGLSLKLNKTDHAKLKKLSYFSELSIKEYIIDLINNEYERLLKEMKVRKIEFDEIDPANSDVAYFYSPGKKLNGPRE